MENDNNARCELRMSGTPADQLSLVFFNDTDWKNGYFLPLCSYDGRLLPSFMCNFQYISYSTSTTINVDASANVTVNFTKWNWANDYIAIPIGCNYGVVQSCSVNKENETVSLTLINLSSVAHTLSGRIILIGIR